jgi:hypothetical protein
MAIDKERLRKVDDRIVVLVKKYPVVFAAVSIGGMVVGALITGAIVWAF